MKPSGITQNQVTDDFDIIWGAKAIGKVINRTPRVTYLLLDAGEIPGAKKIGERWCVPLKRLRETFGMTEAA